MKKFLENAFVFAALVFFMWLTVSMIEINGQNKDPDTRPQYWKYNAFVVFENLIEGV